MNRLIIGTVAATLTPDEIRNTPDDRQELIKTVEHTGGAFVPSVAVFDGGCCDAGQIMAVSGVKFSAANFATIKGYFDQRTAVSVTDLNGVQTSNCRIVLRQWTENKRFDIITADLEVWRI